jgi:hypothetical protein
MEAWKPKVLGGNSQWYVMVMRCYEHVIVFRLVVKESSAMRQDIMGEHDSLGLLETCAMCLLVKRKSLCVSDVGMLHVHTSFAHDSLWL